MLSVLARFFSRPCGDSMGIKTQSGPVKVNQTKSDQIKPEQTFGVTRSLPPWGHVAYTTVSQQRTLALSVAGTEQALGGSPSS